MRFHRALFPVAALWVGSMLMSSLSVAQTVPLELKVSATPKKISPDLFGIFFEDLNFAADGGLYAELIRNRSFDFDATENPSWNALTGWDRVERGGRGALSVDATVPVHANNPTCAVLEVFEPGDGVGMSNAGYDGIAVTEGEAYDVSLLARHLYSGNRWGGPRQENVVAPATPPRAGERGPILVRLETKEGELLAEASLAMPGKEWTRLTATLTPTRTDKEARFVLLMNVKAGVALDMISLFPKKTFRNRANGLRADLAQHIADLKPRFVRFPGGCLVHGSGVGNMYRWKDTIGPIEERKGQANLWRYHQSMGLGYFEYFQFCEDIGAKPVPVVPAGVSCQNSGFTGGTGQRALPMEEMPAYIQEVLDLIEYANGPADSTWGARRAAAGHPEPFGLEYLGVGNEEHITPAFKERFKLIYDAVKAKHPEITVIGTVGPSWQGDDYEAGWAFTREQKIECVDEHYYVAPDWFWDHLDYYDKYDRNSATVYLGEYAAHDDGRRSTLRSALAEAAYMTSLERNGEVVRLASYAPLLGKHRRTQWTPNLIYFDNTSVSPTINYEVQKLFSLNAGDELLPIEITSDADASKREGKVQWTASCVRDSATGDLIVKVVSRSDAALPVRIELGGLASSNAKVIRTVLSGDPLAENAFGVPASIRPVVTEQTVADIHAQPLPPHSLTILRIVKKN